jgi:hypothetical protein
MSAVVCSPPVLLLVAGLLVLVVFGGLVAWAWCWVLSPIVSSALERVEPPASRIYRERDAAIADIVAIRREAERQMRELAREDPGDVIDSTAVDLPPKRDVLAE